MNARKTLAKGIFVLLCGETIFSVPYRSVFLAVHSVRLSWVAGLIVCGLAGVCMAWRNRLSGHLEWIAEARGWLAIWILVGLLLRLVWALRFPITLKSDGLAYYLGGASLAQQHTYSGAFWPPGFPLFLAPFFAVLGPHVWVTVMCALLLFAATYWMTYRLALRIGGETAGRIACVLVALWPTDIALTEVNCKETLLGLLVTSALVLYLKADESKWFVAGAGVMLGLAALTQPGYMLFPAVILGFELIRRSHLQGAAIRVGILVAAMVLAILPWTYRNYTMFHRVVLISTNGGSVFYRANNPMANAGYSAEGEEVLPKDEFSADKEGYRAAKAWIRAEPVAFAVLMVRKQVVYLGDDGIGPYESLKRGLQPSAKLYGLAKAVCNAFWLGCWVVLLMGLTRLFQRTDWVVWFGICFLPLVYQWGIDSVFESGSRHHVPYVALIAVMVGMVMGEPRWGARRGSPVGQRQAVISSAA